MKNHPKPLTLIVGVKDHIGVINLLRSVNENVEVILVLNKAPSLIKNIIECLSFDNLTLKIVEIQEPSLGKIKNRGIQEASNENILLLDADCVLEKEALKREMRCLEHYEIGKVNILVQEKGRLSKILSKNRVPSKPNAAYTPGLFFRKSIIKKIDGYYYRDDLPWREDYELKQRIERNNVHVHYLEDAIVYHPPYKLVHDLRTALRCGGGQQIGCKKGYIKPTLKWGGGRGLFRSLLFDLVRFPYLLTVVFCKDCNKFGLVSAVYKIFWKGFFTIGYYTQMFFNFLKDR